MPRVTVVIPTRDRAALLPRALSSVLAQTFRDFEVVVVDDHSADDTPGVVAGCGDPRVRSLRHGRRRGQSRALNAGIERARGEYVAFLDDDDEWLPGKLAAQVAALDAAPPEVGLVYGWRDLVDDATGRSAATRRKTMRGDIFEQMLALDLPLPPSSWLVRVSAARAVGGFDERLRLAKDVDFMVRLCERGCGVDFVPEVVLRKHRHAGGQMTDRTRPNAALRAAFVRAHMKRFDAELRTRPAARAGVLLRLANHELAASGRLAAAGTVARALAVDPLGSARALLGRRPTFCLALARLLRGAAPR